MNIPIESIAKAVSKGLTIEEYIVLCITNDGCSYLFNQDYPSLQSISNLVANGYFNSKEEITEKGIKFLEETGGVMSNKIDNKYELLHKKLQTELLTLTQKRQKNLQGKYPFLPNSKDLATRLSKIIKKYKLDDWNRVEKLLIDYIYTCHKANWEYVQTIEYHIEKLGSSKLATDYFNDDVKEEIEIKKGDTFNI